MNTTKEAPDTPCVCSISLVPLVCRAFPIARALDHGADVVITGRCVDSALVLGPLIHKVAYLSECTYIHRMCNWQLCQLNRNYCPSLFTLLVAEMETTVGLEVRIRLQQSHVALTFLSVIHVLVHWSGLIAWCEGNESDFWTGSNGFPQVLTTLTPQLIIANSLCVVTTSVELATCLLFYPVMSVSHYSSPLLPHYLYICKQYGWKSDQFDMLAAGR